ncbi:hypothetical protein Pmani_023850 [Petrolisthes manimaculis]|uniref:Uncharacterized protein n=1 Tax=Petrolisthes manimaculis TaxID=1843537 RepID=A0AAE1PAD2_9EUCA|nr:hypothetical protein Pmani_023850 [Petrolisthes manimaculis]
MITNGTTSVLTPPPPHHNITSTSTSAAMKFIVFACLAALTTAGRLENNPPIAIIHEHRETDGAGNFEYSFEADNGIQVESSGSTGSEGQIIMEGRYQYLTDEGKLIEVNYIANEDGFQPQSDIIPTSHSSSPSRPINFAAQRQPSQPRFATQRQPPQQQFSFQ